MDKAYTVVFALSFICCTSGFFMVVVFTYIFVIPYRVSKERLFTQCLVTAFFRLHQSEHLQNCTYDVNKNHVPTKWTEAHNGSYCVGVKVMYKRLDTTWHYGVVSLGKSNTNLIEVQNSSFVPPCCPTSVGSCTLINKDPPHRIHREPAYHSTLSTAPPGGNTCHLKLDTGGSTGSSYQSISLAQQLLCFYSEAPTLTMVIETLPSHPVIVNIVLWPTVLFICGFVGMFFSCIKMQYSQSHTPQRPNFRTETLL